MHIETGQLDTILRMHWEAFRKVYPSNAHLHLACHAAFPIALTSDLLYKIWLNFRPDTSSEDPLEPLIVVADLLHSSLCREIGRDVYEIHPAIRETLLQGLKDAEDFGETRMYELARFLKDYLQYNPEKIPNLALKEAQSWLVASYLEPEKAAKLILDLLQQEEENPDAGIKIDYFLSWAKERNKLSQVSGNAGDALLTAEQMVLGIRQYKAGDLEGALERLEPIQELFMEGEEKIGKGFKTKIPTEVWRALRPSGYESKPKSLALERIEQVKINRARRLDLGNFGLTEIPTELSELSWLEELILSENKNLSDINILSALPNLIMLNLYDTQVNNISPLSNLVHLEDLVLARTEISDLSPLSGLMNLKILHANETQITDILPLAILADLTEIDISNTKVGDMMPLSKLLKLTKINCSNTNTNDLLFTSNLLDLQEIRVSSTMISDLSPLQNLKKLELLYIANTFVTDITPIIPLLELQLIELDIDGCDLDEPPNEITNEGVGAILKYFINKNSLKSNVENDGLKKVPVYKSERDSYSDFGTPVFLIVSSYNYENQKSMLAYEEIDRIQNVFRADASINRTRLIAVHSALLEDLIDKLIFYSDSIELLHIAGDWASYFSGNNDTLNRLKSIFHKCSRLEIVFLSGSATVSQINTFLDIGIPCLIATNFLEDNVASDFSYLLYQSLLHKSSLMASFEFALATVQTRYDNIIIEINPDISHDLPHRPTCGLFVKDEKLLSWTMMLNNREGIKLSGELNEYLLNTLLVSLADFNEKCKNILSRRENGEEVAALDINEAVLMSLPQPISEQIRMLIVSKGVENENTYNAFSTIRLKKIINIFEFLMEILGCIFLSELQDSVLQGHRLSKDEVEKIRELLLTDPGDKRLLNLLQCIEQIVEIMQINNFTYFVSELETLGNQLIDKKSSLIKNINFLDYLNPLEIGDNEFEIKELCLMSERALADIISALAFLSAYIWVSVKEVSVLKSKYKSIMFSVKLVEIVQKFTGPREMIVLTDTPFENQSVILINGKNSSNEYLNLRSNKYLTLSPFVIDQNAFDEKSSIAKLYMFANYNKKKGFYDYKSMYKDDLLSISIYQENFTGIMDQLNGFCHHLFNKDMQNL